jgi:hypothetical protein
MLAKRRKRAIELAHMQRNGALVVMDDEADLRLAKQMEKFANAAHGRLARLRVARSAATVAFTAIE